MSKQSCATCKYYSEIKRECLVVIPAWLDNIIDEYHYSHNAIAPRHGLNYGEDCKCWTLRIDLSD